MAPQIGELALPGGFINYGESWQEAGARELLEETGIRMDPSTLQLFTVHSAPDSTLLVFSLAPPLSSAPEFVPNAEVTEWVVIEEPIELAFSTHTSAVQQYFAAIKP